MFGDDEHVLASIEAGALGYIHKDCSPDDVAQVILEMKGGASPISPMIARKLLARYAGLRTNALVAATSPQQPVGGVRPLTAREQDVLSLIARGFSYAEVARLLSVSVHTVQAHIKSLYAKLAVHSKNEAVFEATRLGLI
jgi:DNA-binding NarL/FixJ family response regulator